LRFTAIGLALYLAFCGFWLLSFACALALSLDLPEVNVLALAANPMGQDQYVQIVSYSGTYVQFVAKPFRTSVMTYNCTIEAFSKRDFNKINVIVENKTVLSANWTGFYWSHDLILPRKKKLDVVVSLNGVVYVFHLLLTQRTPTYEELERIRMIQLTEEELRWREWRAWGGAVVGGIALSVPVAFLIAKRIRLSRVEEL